MFCRNYLCVSGKVSRVTSIELHDASFLVLIILDQLILVVSNPRLIVCQYKDEEVLSLWGQLRVRMDQFFEGVSIEPSLLHGDLWQGNASETKDSAGTGLTLQTSNNFLMIVFINFFFFIIAFYFQLGT